MQQHVMRNVAACLLVHERLDVERLHDISVELRVQVRVANALVQQLAHLRAQQHRLLFAHSISIPIQCWLQLNRSLL